MRPPAPAADPAPAGASVDTGLNRQLWRRFTTMAAPYWHSDERWKARGLLVLLVVLLLGQTAFSVLFNQESGEFTSALAAGDAARFWASIRRFTLLLVIAVPIYACCYYVRDTLALLWRRWLTGHLLQRYFARRAYYHLHAHAAIDGNFRFARGHALAARSARARSRMFHARVHEHAVGHIGIVACVLSHGALGAPLADACVDHVRLDGQPAGGDDRHEADGLS